MSINNKIVLFLSVFILISSVIIQTKDLFIKEKFELEYEYINTKDMAATKISTKVKNKKSKNIISNLSNMGEITAISLNAIEKPEAVEIPVKNNSQATVINRPIWYLPTEIGQITQYPSYWHVAYDITSPRGYGETIHPVANGVVSGIYTDSAGALIVTVLHQVNGKKYTSQYVHLSSYAPGLHIGQNVTINDSLGQMGTTGYSTGVHLHLAVLDCALFDSNDPNCSDLNGWYNYARLRISQDFLGIGSLMYMPSAWNSR